MHLYLKGSVHRFCMGGVHRTVTISGTAEVGQTLSVSNNLADADGLGTITYQWYRDGHPIIYGGTLKDGVNGVDGLDKVYSLAVSSDGKHVYSEKPLAHSVAEVRTLTKAAKEKGVITQVGNQGHSSEHIRLFCEMIWAGAIGNVSEVHCGCDAFKNVY